MGFLSGLLGGIIGPGAGEKAIEFFEKKQQLKNDLELAKLAGDIKVAEAKAAYQAADLQYDDQWELEQIKNSGWKDEYVLVLLSIPLVMVFIPPLAPYVLSGFAILATCPEWYRWLLTMIFAAIYGIRVWRRQDGKPPQA